MLIMAQHKDFMFVWAIYLMVVESHIIINLLLLVNPIH
jgi:hypothetical protein